jgi:predicted ATPase/class 3 adenylate cyclase
MAEVISAAPSLPDGTVTFVFTDVVGSTELWDRASSTMREAMVTHDRLIERAVEINSGAVVRPRGEGDSRFAVFRHASDALSGAAEVLELLENEVWKTPVPIRIRVGIHTGEADLREGDYYGRAVNLCARIRGLAEPNQVLVSEATSRLLLRSGARIQLYDAGIHALKGISVPEHVYSLTEVDNPPTEPLGQFAAAERRAESWLTLKDNLPAQLSSFIAREGELDEVVDLLTESRLVTLVGAGGAGKTRLALEVASALVDSPRDGVWLVELASVESSDLVDLAVLNAVGLSEQPGESILDTLIATLRARRVMLILDNCEHLIAACAHVVDTLLGSCDDVRVLATSRERLGLRGEAVYRVPSLSLPPAELFLDPTGVAKFGAVQLFMDRAHDHNRSLQLNSETSEDIVAICRQVDGIPLAIELAAARLRSMSIHEIASRIHDRLRLLTGGSRTDLPRQQTLRALIDWSYALLNEPEKLVLQRLSVFVDGFEADIAEQVCNRFGLEAFDVFDTIASLVDKSLIQLDQAGSFSRYRLLETVRQYAAEILTTAPDDERVTLDAHADAYIALAERAAPELEGARQFEWIEQLNVEFGNLRTAFKHFCGDGDRASEILRLTTALGSYWHMTGRYREGIEMLETALESPDAGELRALRISALSSQLNLRFYMGETLEPAQLEDAIALARTLSHPEMTALLLLRIWLKIVDGDLDDALAMADETVSGARLLNQPMALARALGQRSLVFEYLGEADHEVEDLTECMHWLKATGNKFWLTAALNNIAGSELRSGHLDDAEEHARSAYGMAVDANFISVFPYIAGTLSCVCLLRGELETAKVFALESLEYFRRTGDLGHGADSVLLLALSMSRMGLNEQAVRLFGVADEMNHGIPLQEPNAHLRAEDMDRLRRALGDQVFDDGYRQGKESATIEDVIAFVEAV